MNAFAARGVEASLGRHVRKPRPGKRPRHFVAGFIGSFVAFIIFVRNFYHREEDAVWIWMGMRSDSRCGRDFGTEYVKETTCGKGSCCSSHGWCGTTEEYCSVALGCQNGCWKVDDEEQKKIDAKNAHPDDDDYHGHMDDDGGAYHRHRGYRYDDDGGYRGYHHRYRGHDDDDYHDYNHRYDEDPDLYRHAEEYPGDHGDHHDGDYEHYGDHGEHDHPGDDEHHVLDEDHDHYEDDEHYGHHDDQGYKCYDENFDFMKCKSKQGDAPSACEAQGTAVHQCVYGLFKEISGKAAAEFSAYAKCLDQNDLKAHKCKQTQAAFEATYYAA